MIKYFLKLSCNTLKHLLGQDFFLTFAEKGESHH